MTQPVLVNFVLDKSGSMHHLQQATIEGFNSFLQDQRQQPGECRMSLTQFDTSFQVDYVAEDIFRVPLLNTMTYRPGGGTALLDAVGTTIKGAEQWLINQKFNRQVRFQGPPIDYKVIVAILTDGDENSSVEWHLRQPLTPGDDKDVGGLIQWKQNEGWEFIFLGTGGSNWLERTFGAYVPQQNFYGYAHTHDAHTHTYAGLSNTISSTRTTGNFDTSHLHNIDQGQPVTPPKKRGTTK